MKAEIREMSPSDLEEVISLWQNVEGLGLREAEESPKHIKNCLLRNPGLSFVAHLQSKLVGAVLCGHDGRRGYIYHLAVAKPHRRSGIGRAMVKSCVAALRKAGIERCHLFVFETNVPAQEFWKALGWQLREEIKLMSCSIINGEDGPC